MGGRESREEAGQTALSPAGASWGAGLDMTTPLTLPSRPLRGPVFFLMLACNPRDSLFNHIISRDETLA